MKKLASIKRAQAEMEKTNKISFNKRYSIIENSLKRSVEVINKGEKRYTKNTGGVLTQERQIGRAHV